jgi:hypothetical protein
MNAADLVVVEGTEQRAGAIVWWRLSGNISHAALLAAWEGGAADKHGRTLSNAWLPGEPSARAALRRAVQSVTGPRRLARPLPAGAGWALVEERPSKDNEKVLEHEVVLTCAIDSACAMRGFAKRPDAVPLGGEIRAEYERARTALDAGDIGSWLSDLVRSRLHAVALRDSGGIYFVPRSYVERYAQVRDVLRTCSAHVLHEVPALRTEEAVAAILSALEDEAKAAVDDMVERIGRTGDEALGKRGLASQVARLDRLRDKVAGYEALLGARVEGLREHLVELTATTTAAVLAADQEAA